MLAELEAQVRSLIPRLTLAERYELRELLVRLTTECEPMPTAQPAEKRTAAEVFPPPPFSEHEILLRDIDEQPG